MFVWIVTETQYETEGCPEHSSWTERAFTGTDEKAVQDAAEKCAAELQREAYRLTEYCAERVWDVTEV